MMINKLQGIMRISSLLLSAVLLLLNNGNGQTVPPYKDYALMARYIIHVSDWVSIATISTLDNVKGYPFVTLKSMSDGPVSNGTGIPYLYMTDLDLSGKDVLTDNRVTIMCSLAEVDYCKSQNFDPQDPRCARLIISGKLVKVTSNTPEFSFAKNALYARHPAMKYWPADHGFYVAKINIEEVLVLDYFGGAAVVPIDQYFNPNGTVPRRRHNLFEDVMVIDIEEQYVN